jgi:NADH-quinone oxidoreductase subunit N
LSFDELVQSVVQDTVGKEASFEAFRNSSLWAFRPELTLCATIVAILLARTFLPRWRSSTYYVTLVGLCLAIYLAVPWHWLDASVPPAKPIFTGLLLSDSFGAVMRGLLLLFAVLFATFTQISEKGDRRACCEVAEDGSRRSTPAPLSSEFYVLMLGALVGMCLMISANHLLIVMLGVEMASVPCYVLAGMQRDRSTSSEAAMKYAVFGAGAAGVMLYGLSLLAGALGTTHIPTMATRLAELIQSGAGADRTMVLVLGGLMLMVGVAFKLSAVPFHFWAPDVFEGATAEVAAFLSVASKVAALGLLVRLAAGFSFQTAPEALAALAPVRHYIFALLAVLSAVTCTFGNLAAYGQTNMKRLLAYSTIAHAGYMMMPVAAAVALVDVDTAAARSAIASLVVYIGIYLFMNLAAFAVVAFLRNAIGSEEIADYAGLVHTSPGLCMCMAIVMFSLVGLPPLAGFQAKFGIFYALVQANAWTLLFVGAINTVLSLFYYLRVVRVMIFLPQPLYHPAPVIPLSSMVGSYCALLTFPLVALFFFVGGLLNWAHAAADALFY